MYFFTFFRTFFLILFVDLVPFYCFGQDASCCWKTSGSCRTACEQISLAAIAADPDLREESFENLRNFCSEQLKHFWECINGTLVEIRKGEEWSGRQCCSLAQLEKCRKACVTATSRDDLKHNCRRSDEMTFFTCLNKQQLGDECCGNARSVDCQKTCKLVFKSTFTPNKEIRNSIIETCNDTSPKVIQCVKNFIKVTPATNVHRYLHCCDKSGDLKCKNTCKKILKTKFTDQEIVDSLQEGGCGPPLPQNKFWQCFLHSNSPSEFSTTNIEISRIDRVGMDSAKLHCCNKATSTTCRRLCIKTFSDEWTKFWKDFDQECLSKLSEDKLLQCLDEVEEPCELGCDGLSYCSNFNNRPLELFRSCNNEADEAAKYDVALWQQQGFFSLPGGIQILVKNISHCSPNMWKAVACALQVKPCHRQNHSNRICREDCYEMLSQCVDWSRMSRDQTAASICSKLSPTRPFTPCISLRHFLEPSDHPYSLSVKEVTTPCKGEPCNSDEICLVNRNCGQENNCQSYKCVPGCRMGEVSHYMVPYGSYVRIPVPTESKGCQKICQCSNHGVIENCQPMPCVPADNCWLGTRKIDHGSSFVLDCNICACLSGEITCSKKQCKDVGIDFREVSFSSLPCNCPTHHVPVCGRNGNTYSSSCLAKCAGLRDVDFEFGSCSSRNPCEQNPCGAGKKCIFIRNVCLSLLEKPCRQYHCIDLNKPCSEILREPVCDTDQNEHYNLCYLAKSGKTFAYNGPCLKDCRTDGVVCGIDGETYISQCAARANHVLDDYRGPCSAIGLISTEAKPQCGPSIACSSLPATGCFAVTPPGACCPICAGALRFLFSRKQLDRALYALRGNLTSALTMTAILNSLERQIQVAECSLKGFLTVELDIFVAVIPNNEYKATEFQREICVREAEKLANLVKKSSPRILSDLGLSSLIAVTIVHVMSSTGSLITVGVFGIWLSFIFSMYTF